jgi:hypothetical protein
MGAGSTFRRRDPRSVDHPGVTAPLGWSLGDAAVDDLVNQVTESRNNETLTQLHAILDDAADGGSDLHCWLTRGRAPPRVCALVKRGTEP